ncbi:MAG TPA: GNAT family N-acetyltransferase [Aggregatilineaceae bacterium]|jgi:GNAT superfamily N-acetyltransferase|nr:GNAT family N-acetyltransferase [Anaerolineae bacterium]HMM28428.1 GNAT family N-acetyltransferase [Aggregatilineaceae bacterium]
MSVITINPGHPLWLAFVIHLGRHDMARIVLDEDGAAQPDVHYLAASIGDLVVGNLCLRYQPILIPADEASGGEPTPLLGPGEQPFTELFVCAFAVENEYRRQGHGRELQLAGLALARELGCYQVRSWSSLDKAANFALKMSLGFALHPAVEIAANGAPISGAYFVMHV